MKDRTKIRVTQSIPIARQTVPGLLETFRAAFSGKNRPVRILYTKGEDLVVERATLDPEEDIEGPFITPYQIIRQHAEIEMRAFDRNALITACSAVQDLRQSKYELTFIVCRDPIELAQIPGGLSLVDVFGVEILYDPECPEGLVFFCGSSTSSMISDIEKVMICKME